MPIRHMQQYARLLRQGDGTTAERRALLERHRQEVRARMRTLSENLRMIEKKIRHYDALGAPIGAARRTTSTIPAPARAAAAPRRGSPTQSLHLGSELVSHRQTG